MKFSQVILLIIPGLLLPGTVLGGESSVDFEKDIRPILVQRCYECHSAGAKKVRGGFLLDSREGLLRGGDSGPAIVPGDASASRLMEAVSYTDPEFQMPPSGKLPEHEIDALSRWVESGAPDPREEGSTVEQQATGMSIEEGRRFWSFQPVEPRRPVDVSRPDWVERKIDFFILEQLDREGLAPSSPAARRTLIRRATLDLTGLPPTPDQVQQFVNDPSPDAYARVIDRLLSSPQHGERWARVWLDSARYTDHLDRWEWSEAEAWLYRDWVIRAFNDDVPYTDFVKRQLATDLMPETGPEDIPALGFLGLSPSYWKELKLHYSLIKGTVAKEWEERVDAIGRTFLGLTLACARCHDHKYDPIKTADYYALAGVFASIRLIDRPLLSDEESEPYRQIQKEVEAVREKRLKLLGDDNTEAEKKRLKELWNLIVKKTEPLTKIIMARAVEEASLYVLDDGARTKLDYRKGEPRDLRIHIRGDPMRLGPLVPRRFISVLSPDPPRPFRHASGRLELATAIVSDAAPLASRVLVNRIWKQHFGRGIVDTPSNFGVLGSRPSHPRLLDDLAARFIRSGWSIKWLHREIMLSATYRQSSDHDASRHAVDPDNRWLWRMNRRRLGIEAWRDSMLFVADALILDVGGSTPWLKSARKPTAGTGNLQDPNNRRRTIYGSVDRRNLDKMLLLHDFPDPASHSPGREPTTTPVQQLFALNSAFVMQQATRLHERLNGLKLKAGGLDDVEPRVQRVHEWLFARPASKRSLRWAREFLLEDGVADRESWIQYLHALLASNEFAFVD